MKTCNECQQRKDDSEFHQDNRSSDGLVGTCKTCRKLERAVFYQENKEAVLIQTKAWKTANRESYLAQQREYAKERGQTVEGKFQQYKGNAGTRGLPFDLTFEKFAEFWQQPCYYCGAEIETIGIDRIDSDQGYSTENTVSCCTDCNHFKLDLTSEEFIRHCIKIVKHAKSVGKL